MKKIFYFITRKRSIGGMLATACGFMLGLSILLTVTSVMVVAVGGGPQAVRLGCMFMVIISVPVALTLIYHEWHDKTNTRLGACFVLFFSALGVGIFMPVLWITVFFSLKKQRRVLDPTVEKKPLMTKSRIPAPTSTVAPSLIRQIEQIFSDRLEDGKHFIGA